MTIFRAIQTAAHVTVDNRLLKSNNLQRIDCDYQQSQQPPIHCSCVSSLIKDFPGNAELWPVRKEVSYDSTIGRLADSELR